MGVIFIDIDFYTNLYLNINKVENRKLKVDTIIKRNNSLVVKQNILNLKNNQELLIILQNIKTKEQFKCNYLIEDNNIVLLVDSLLNLFTDYEWALQILCKNDDIHYLYTPILNESIIVDDQNCSDKPYKLFLRVLENKELRISAVCKK